MAPQSRSRAGSTDPNPECEVALRRPGLPAETPA